MATRRDTGVILEKPIKMDNGYLKLSATPTRSGIFLYRQSDGSIKREYRPPEEVFKVDSLETLKNVPVTLDHPSELLNSKNTALYQVGSVLSDVTTEGDYVAANILLTHDAAIQVAERGDKREVSCGYECDMDETQGVTPTGERYDAIQRNIRYNHLAIVKKGRAGEGSKLKFDACEILEYSNQVEETHGKEVKMPMVKMDVGGVSLEIEESLASAIEKERAYTKEKLDNLDSLHSELKTAMDECGKLKKDAEDLQAKNDELQEQVKKLDSAEHIHALVTERQAICDKACKFLKEDLQKMDNLDIIKSVVFGEYPDLKDAGKSDDYIRARFDALAVPVQSEELAKKVATKVDEKEDPRLLRMKQTDELWRSK